jgi:hypothetical protein
MKLFTIRKNRRSERGISLLEYCAGAAVLLGIVWTAMTLMGQDVSALLQSIGGWAVAQKTDIDAAR